MGLIKEIIKSIKSIFNVNNCIYNSKKYNYYENNEPDYEEDYGSWPGHLTFHSDLTSYYDYYHQTQSNSYKKQNYKKTKLQKQNYEYKIFDYSKIGKYREKFKDIIIITKDFKYQVVNHMMIENFHIKILKIYNEKLNYYLSENKIYPIFKMRKQNIWRISNKRTNNSEDLDFVLFHNKEKGPEFKIIMGRYISI